MSETKKFAFKWVNDAYEDDLFTWLQYPTGDSFDRSYCDEILDGGWPLPLTSPAEAVTAKLPDEINHSDGANATRCRADRLANRSSDRSTNTSEYGGVKSILEPRHYFNSTIDRALAEGAARAAGQTLIATEDPCGKVRTLMQPSQTDPHSRSGSGDLESWKHAIQQNTGPYVSTSSVPVSAAVDQGRTDPFSATGTLPSHPRQRKHGASDTAEAKAAKDIRDYEVHSRNYLADSSRVTENGFGRQGKMVNHADQEHTATSSSWLGTSQGTSSSMSFRGASASGKRKQADLEVYADSEPIDEKKHQKSKRNRVAEVHNLSERNRRNRINQKIKALQELIPNSKKVDKASVLDEAIEYMKILQMQLQMVSLRNSFTAPTLVMAPMALPQAAQLQMTQPQSIGFGLPIGHMPGMGLGIGVLETGTPSGRTVVGCPTLINHHTMHPAAGTTAVGFPQMGSLHNNQAHLSTQTAQEVCLQQ
ncbi:hypothetical protein KP509_34G041700 [Ceratopteris richardii]|uniref:BHLH domain-containing protein n=1 Tax=Ceratopteris richardii TaxID=49495 RepID=A0A8T2QKL7_CERRI|nr:hypothetical protein KP509_34G041700 [Ceratopteris richardii]